MLTHHQLSESSKSEAFALKSLDEWRKLMTRKESPDNDESQLLIDTNYSLNKKVYNNLIYIFRKSIIINKSNHINKENS